MTYGYGPVGRIGAGHISRSAFFGQEGPNAFKKREGNRRARRRRRADWQKKVPWGTGRGARRRRRARAKLPSAGRVSPAEPRAAGEGTRERARVSLARPRRGCAPRTPAPRLPAPLASAPPSLTLRGKALLGKAPLGKAPLVELCLRGRRRVRPRGPRGVARGGVYDTLGAEVDALRAALESQTRGEAELLAANAALLQRCEEAEASAEASRPMSRRRRRGTPGAPRRARRRGGCRVARARACGRAG